MDSSGIEGKVALVTGAARGIGSAVVTSLVNLGATVAAADSDIDALTEFADKVGASPYQMDVRNSSEVETTLARIRTDIADIDILVNVAGVLRTGPAVELTDDDWAAVFAVNVDGVFRVSRAVAKRMRERRSGAIVTVGSNAAMVPRMHMAAYCASKAASAQFTRCLGLELAEYGVRCNVVAPGSTDTAMLRSMWTDDYGPQEAIQGAAEQYRVGIPLRKLAQPADVASAVTFLASDHAQHITMHELVVDGGAAL